MPAVASAGAPPRLTATRPSGSATIVSSPLRTTIAPRGGGGAARRPEPVGPTSALSTPSSRPSSPACGVSTVGAWRPASRASAPGVGVQSVGVEQQRHLATRAASSRASRRGRRLASECRGRARAPARARCGRAPYRAPPRWSAPSSSGSGTVMTSSSRLSKIAFSDAGTHAVTYPAPARIAASEARHGAPVRPVEPPHTSTLPAANLFESAPRLGIPAMHRVADQPDGRLDTATVGGCRCRPPQPTGAASCPVRSTARAWRRGRSRWRRARTAAPAISPVDASTPLGTSQATTAAAPAPLIASIAPLAGSRGVAGEAGAEDRIDDRRGPVQRGGLEPDRRSARRAARGSPRVAPELVRRAEQEDVDLAPALAQPARGHEPVTAVVALAADDHDPALRRRAPRSARPGRCRRAPSARLRAVPSSSIAQLSSSRCSAGVGQRLQPIGQRHPATATAPASRRVWVSDTLTSTPSSAARAAAAPCRRS